MRIRRLPARAAIVATLGIAACDGTTGEEERIGSASQAMHFQASLEGMSLRARDRIAEVAPLFS